MRCLTVLAGCHWLLHVVGFLRCYTARGELHCSCGRYVLQWQEEEDAYDRP